MEYVNIIQNPVDIGNRGSNIENLPKEWWNGPRWLASLMTEKEAKMMKEVMCVMCIVIEKSEEIYQLLKEI